MKYMMKTFMLSCRQACLLMAKKEEGKLAALDRMRLRLHTSMCSICKKFDKQTRFILTATAEMERSTALSEEAKDGMRRSIDAAL